MLTFLRNISRISSFLNHSTVSLFLNHLENIWSDRPKVSKRGLTELQMGITFFGLEITPIMYILRESHRFEDFEKIKIFGFLMLFCNQNDLSVKIWVFAKSAHQNTKSCRNKRTSSYRERFFSGRGQVVLFRSPTIFGRYSAGKMNFGQICWCMHQQKIFKIDFFRFLRNFMKCIENVIYVAQKKGGCVIYAVGKIIGTSFSPQYYAPIFARMSPKPHPPTLDAKRFFDEIHTPLALDASDFF